MKSPISKQVTNKKLNSFYKHLNLKEKKARVCKRKKECWRGNCGLEERVRWEGGEEGRVVKQLHRIIIAIFDYSIKNKIKRCLFFVVSVPFPFLLFIGLHCQVKKPRDTNEITITAITSNLSVFKRHRFDNKKM